MTVEADQILILKQERESGAYSYPLEADQDEACQSVSFWDEVAKKWPEQRFSSFFPIYQNA